MEVSVEMMNSDSKQEQLAKTVQAMYNSHPFPNRATTLHHRGDERFEYIYKNFLHISFESLKNKILLDAGCGTGENTWSWRRILDPGTKVLAVDLSESSVNIAHNSNPEQKLTPEFTVGSLMNLGLANQSVDLVFCSGVLVAVAQPKKAFDELVRILKPGGIMILVLYHRYGRATHGFRRAVIDLLERDDPDRRVELGRKLFGRNMKKLAIEEGVPLEGVLYDQFGLPCETRYGIGDALKWFRDADIHYTGTWPPIEWSQFGKAIRFSHQLNKYQHTLLYRTLLKVFPDTDEAPLQSPGFLTRATMETVWLMEQQQLFAISGIKRDRGAVMSYGR